MQSCIPSLKEGQELLAEGGRLHPGPWVQHSFYVAQAAEAIARCHPRLDPQRAYILGCLHDIGRRAGVTDMRHALDGHDFLEHKGFTGAARICITHSFPLRDIQSVAGKWDCTPQELAFISDYLSALEFDEYDRLIQLCDALALPDGFCLIEKRLMDVALRHGLNAYSLSRWRAYFDIQHDFENTIGQSIYSLLPGVVESTFGFRPQSS